MSIETIMTWFEDRSVGIAGYWEESLVEFRMDDMAILVGFDAYHSTSVDDWRVEFIEVQYLTVVPCRYCHGTREYVGKRHLYRGKRCTSCQDGTTTKRHTLLQVDSPTTSMSRRTLDEKERPLRLRDIPPARASVQEWMDEEARRAEQENRAYDEMAHEAHVVGEWGEARGFEPDCPICREASCPTG